MRYTPFFYVLFSLFISSAQAALITVQDGEMFDFDANNEYVFVDGLTTADPQVTYGFILDPSDHSSVRVTAPFGIDLVTRITSGPDFDGHSIAEPGNYSRVLGGTSFDFPLWGDWTGVGSGDVWWLTIGIFDWDSLVSLTEDHGGEIPMSSTFVGSEFLSLPDTGIGGGGSNDDVSPVPAPPSVVLMATGLLLLGTTLWQKRVA